MSDEIKMVIIWIVLFILATIAFYGLKDIGFSTLMISMF